MDIELYYTEQGDGFPLILLHGNGESGAYFDCQREEFARYFRVLIVDTRGHGLSPRGTAPFTLTQFADDLLSFMDEHHLAKAHLLGFSDGGNVALLFALAHPERVGKLVLNGANLFPKGLKTGVRLRTDIDYGLVVPLASISERFAKKRELLGLMVREPRIDPATLTGLTVPTLVVVGTRDMIKAQHSRLIAATLPNADLKMIEGSHFVAAENSTAFNQTILTFLLDQKPFVIRN